MTRPLALALAFTLVGCVSDTLRAQLAVQERAAAALVEHSQPGPGVDPERWRSFTAALLRSCAAARRLAE